MVHLFHILRASSGLREARLLYQHAPKIEVLPEGLRQLSLENLREEMLEQAAESLDESQVQKALAYPQAQLTATEYACISSNLDRLSAVKDEKLRQKAKRLQQYIAVRHTSSGNDRDPAAVADRSEPKEESAEEKNKAHWFPRTIDPRTWTPNQVATLSTVSIGAVGLYALYRFFRSGKKKSDATHEDKEHKGIVPSWVYWIPGIGLGVIAGGLIASGFSKMSEWMKNLDLFKKRSAKEWGELAKDQAGKLKNKVTGAWRSATGKERGERYGITDQEYDRARTIYREKGEAGIDAIRTEICHVRTGDFDPKAEELIQNLRKEFQSFTRDGITYARADVAIDNYELRLKVSLREIEQWGEKHWVDLGVVTYAAHRLGILKAILQSGLSVAEKAVKTAEELALWGVRHPILSLLSVGGTMIGMRTVAAAEKRLLLPENVDQLCKAFNADKPLAMRMTEQKRAAPSSVAAPGAPAAPIDAAIVLEPEETHNSTLFSKLKEHADQLQKIVGNAGEWVTQHMYELIALLDDRLPELIGRTPEEVVRDRNAACFKNLEHYLQNAKDRLSDDRSKVTDGTVALFDRAIDLLHDFEKTYTAERCGPIVQGDRSQVLLGNLRQLLESPAIGLSVTVNAGVVRWQKDEENGADLCVDPMEKDKGTIENLSEKLTHGEGSREQYVSLVVQEIQMAQKRGMDQWKGITGSKAVAMVVGNLVYFLNWENDRRYMVAPLDALTDALGVVQGDTSLPQFCATVTVGALSGTVLTLSLELFSKLRRAVIGGGPLLTNLGSRLLVSMVPYYSQKQFLAGLYRGAIDTDLLLSHWYSGGRRLNTILQYAGVRPEWIGDAAFGNRTQMERVVRKITNFTNAKNIASMTDTQLRAALREHIVHMIEEASLPPDMKILSPKSWMQRLRSGKDASLMKHILKEEAPKIFETVEKWYSRRGIYNKVGAALAVLGEKFGSPGRVARTVLNTAKPLPAEVNAVADRISAWRQQILEAERAGKVTEALEREGAELLEELAKKGGTEAGEAADLLKASRWAKARKVIAVGGKVLSVAGFLLVAFEHYNYWKHQRPELLRKIAMAENPDERSSAERELDARSLRLTFSTAGEVLTFAVPPLGLAIVAGSEVGNFARESVEESTAYHITTLKNIEQDSTGNALYQVSRSAPGQRVSWGQGLAAHPSMFVKDLKQTMEVANTSARSTAYHGYFRQLARLSNDPFKPEALPAKDRTLTGEALQQRIKDMEQEQVSIFATAALRYIDLVTRHQFVTVDAEILRRAASYARQSVADFRLGLLNPAHVSTLPALGTRELEDRLTREMSERDRVAVGEMTALAQKPAELRQVLPFRLLERVVDDLAILDARLIETNYSNVTTLTGWWHWVSDEDLRALARGVFAQRILSIIHRATERTHFTPADLTNLVSEIRDACHGDPDTLALQAARSAQKKSLLQMGSDPHVLSLGGLYRASQGMAGQAAVEQDSTSPLDNEILAEGPEQRKAA